MSRPDKIFEIANDEGVYRVVPNPSYPHGTGYTNGAHLQWQPYESDEPIFAMAIPPENLQALAIALQDAARDLAH